jgi:hypothetical protein
MFNERSKEQNRMNCALMTPVRPLALFALGALPMVGADVVPGVRQIFDKQLSATERDVMQLIEAMPADKFNFVPTEGAFKHARTFAVQARHIAFCLHEVAIALLGETILPHPDQEGPKNVTSREDIVRYLKMRSRTRTGQLAP